jgi:hypothetical protein
VPHKRERSAPVFLTRERERSVAQGELGSGSLTVTHECGCTRAHLSTLVRSIAPTAEDPNLEN